MKHIVMPVGFEVAAVRRRAGHRRKPICMTWDERGRLWVAETVDYPNELQPRGQGPRPDRDLRGHRRRRPGRQVHRLRRQAEHPDQPRLRPRRRDRPPGAATRCSSRTPTATTRPTCARCSSPAGARATRTPGRATCATAFDNWIWGIVGYAGFDGDGRRRAAPVRPGLLPLQARRLEARVPPQHQQQHLGRRLQRGGPASSARRPTATRASTCRSPTATTRRSAAGRRSVLREHRRRQPLPPDHRQGPAGRLPRRLHRRRRATRSTPPAPTRRSTGTAPRSSPSRPATWSATFVLEPRRQPTSRSRNAWNLLASDDEWTAPIMAEVGPDGNVWVIDWYNYIVQHNPTPPASRPARATPTRPTLRDKKHGRIYRVVYKDAKPTEPLDARPGRRRRSWSRR